MTAGFTHLDADGKVRMVDVGEKEPTRREAEAEAVIRMAGAAFGRLRDQGAGKGDALAAAQLAGIQAAKRTSDLIPLCHQIPLDHVEVSFAFDEDASCLTIRARVRARWITGVEMEALTAAAVAALTVYDMCKALDRGMVIERIQLVRKSGGRSGEYRRR